MEIDLSRITNIKVDDSQRFQRGRIFIDFCLDEKTSFYLGLLKTGNDWDSLDVFHVPTRNRSTTCHICDKENHSEDLCYTLTLNECPGELGKLLLSHPNVRLKLLFL